MQFLSKEDSYRKIVLLLVKERSRLGVYHPLCGGRGHSNIGSSHGKNKMISLNHKALGGI